MEMARDAECILLLQSVDANGEPAYAFLKLRGDRLPALRDAMAREQFRPSQFGEILAHGTGTPTDEIYQTMQRDYGFNREQMLSLPLGSA